MLEPFAVEDLRYYGDPRFGGKDHVLAVLKGQAVDDALRAHMAPPDDPYLPGISAIVHTRNEARHKAIGLGIEERPADSTQPWWFDAFSPQPGFVAAVALEGDAAPSRQRYWDAVAASG